MKRVGKDGKYFTYPQHPFADFVLRWVEYRKEEQFDPEQWGFTVPKIRRIYIDQLGPEKKDKHGAKVRKVIPLNNLSGLDCYPTKNGMWKIEGWYQPAMNWGQCKKIAANLIIFRHYSGSGKISYPHMD